MKEPVTYEMRALGISKKKLQSDIPSLSMVIIEETDIPIRKLAIMQIAKIINTKDITSLIKTLAPYVQITENEIEEILKWRIDL